MLVVGLGLVVKHNKQNKQQNKNQRLNQPLPCLSGKYDFADWLIWIWSSLLNQSDALLDWWYYNFMI